MEDFLQLSEQHSQRRHRQQEPLPDQAAVRIAVRLPFRLRTGPGRPVGEAVCQQSTKCLLCWAPPRANQASHSPGRLLSRVPTLPRLAEVRHFQFNWFVPTLSQAGFIRFTPTFNNGTVPSQSYSLPDRSPPPGKSASPQGGSRPGLEGSRGLLTVTASLGNDSLGQWVGTYLPATQGPGHPPAKAQHRPSGLASLPGDPSLPSKETASAFVPGRAWSSLRLSGCVACSFRALGRMVGDESARPTHPRPSHKGAGSQPPGDKTLLVPWPPPPTATAIPGSILTGELVRPASHREGHPPPSR